MSGLSEPNWLTGARALEGLKEIHGSANEPRILALAYAAKLYWVKDDETAWCAIFVGGVLEESGIKSTRNAGARSYQSWGVDVFESGPLAVPLGAIIVFNRPPNPSEGHVAFAVGRNEKNEILCLGGNQHDEVCILAFPTWRVIAARWPEEASDDLRELRRIPLIDSSVPVSTQEA